MALVLNGSGSITGLSAGGLPDGSVTADDIASTLDLSGKTVTLPAGAGGGKVLQVVGASTSTYASTTSTSWTSTGLSLNITPASSSNKILVMYFGMYAANNLSSYWGAHGIDRDGTVLTAGSLLGSLLVNAVTHAPVSLTVLDSPATTSEITYTVVFASEGNSTLVRFGDSWGTFDPLQTITALEIAA